MVRDHLHHAPDANHVLWLSCGLYGFQKPNTGSQTQELCTHLPNLQCHKLFSNSDHQKKSQSSDWDNSCWIEATEVYFGRVTMKLASSFAATSPMLLASAKCIWMMRKQGLIMPRPTARDRFPAPASTMKLRGENAVAISSASPSVRNASATMRHRLGSSSNTLPSLPPTCQGIHYP